MIQENIPLKDHCNYKIGGIADFFVQVNSVDELIEVLSFWQKKDTEFKNIFILGSGTNILFDDEGYRGLVIKNNINFIKREGGLMRVGSGTLMSDLVSFYLQNGLVGLEWAGGLPGTVGGAIRGNAGAFGGEVKDNVLSVESLKFEDFGILNRSNIDCNFEYRNSIFKKDLTDSEIIISAVFECKEGDLDEIKKITQKNIDYRIDRHPLNLPNIGSIFKNVDLKLVSSNFQKEFESSIKKDPFPVLPVAKLIIGAGLIGKIIGGAQISTKHPNFIVNINNAKAGDVLSLIDLVKKEIKNKYSIEIEEEVIIK